MKKILFFLFAFVVSATTFAQSKKMVVASNGEVVGRYVRTNATTYTVDCQDTFEVPIKGHKVVVFSAEKGQGFISCKKPGSVNVRSTPSTSGSKIGTLSYFEGDIPDTYPCLGKTNGWYKVRVGNKVGYVRQDLVDWTEMDM